MGPEGCCRLVWMIKQVRLPASRPVPAGPTRFPPRNRGTLRRHPGRVLGHRRDRRKDFNITTNILMDGGGVVIGDIIQLFIEVEAILQQPAEALRLGRIARPDGPHDEFQRPVRPRPRRTSWSWRRREGRVGKRTLRPSCARRRDPPVGYRSAAMAVWSRSRKGTCAAFSLRRAWLSLNHSTRSISGKVSTRPDPGGHSIW